MEFKRFSLSSGGICRTSYCAALPFGTCLVCPPLLNNDFSGFYPFSCCAALSHQFSNLLLHQCENHQRHSLYVCLAFVYFKQFLSSKSPFLICYLSFTILIPPQLSIAPQNHIYLYRLPGILLYCLSNHFSLNPRVKFCLYYIKKGLQIRFFSSISLILTTTSQFCWSFEHYFPLVSSKTPTECSNDGGNWVTTIPSPTFDAI